MEISASLEEQVAQVVAGMGQKRHHDGPDNAGGYRPSKLARFEEIPMPTPIAAPGNCRTDGATPAAVMGHQNSASAGDRQLRPAPFFYYRDFSRNSDPDPLTPLTPPGRVPNFPAKMHAILSRSDLADVIAWMPHGRSWRVLKPREFECKVIPTYFEHAKFSSFIRQANGWGFRRITQGCDRNSYYHPQFLRGLPHLCKTMKRPGVSEKGAVDPDHEPDFYKISEQYPVPDKAEDDSIMLHCTVQGGPKARMPIYSGSLMSSQPLAATVEVAAPHIPNVQPAVQLNSASAMTPMDQTTLSGFQRAVDASDNQIRMHKPQEQTLRAETSPQPMASTFFLPQSSFTVAQTASPAAAAPVAPVVQTTGVDARMACLAAADRLAFTVPQQPQATNQKQANALQAQQMASQFAAGFAAATALTDDNMRVMLSQALTANNLPPGATIQVQAQAVPPQQQMQHIQHIQQVVQQVAAPAPHVQMQPAPLQMQMAIHHDQ
eukprot:CAMPEP_0194028814 /NCGR_PEP_ID=MMETSP0009_2-20130614/2702_1 /TAXON_ID=210454 /ORGANISM="Grammatophora oceanica, Strain CCMP 410" /LENGTH=490 /DNA_ID=CAMNT_0038668315 /DNA_START=186 /DNA_END=1658 /DNA_ORIENTATION=-